jgi:hypothetical protein
MRSWSAQLDSKLTALQHFIRLADDAAARLEAAVADARYLDASTPRAPAVPVEPSARVASQADGLRASLRRAATAPSPGTPGEGWATHITEAAESSAGERPVSRIHSLADAGYDATAIAQQVGSPIGEVELILSLRRQAAG